MNCPQCKKELGHVDGIGYIHPSPPCTMHDWIAVAVEDENMREEYLIMLKKNYDGEMVAMQKRHDEEIAELKRLHNETFQEQEKAVDNLYKQKMALEKEVEQLKRRRWYRW